MNGTKINNIAFAHQLSIFIFFRERRRNQRFIHPQRNCFPIDSGKKKQIYKRPRKNIEGISIYPFFLYSWFLFVFFIVVFLYSGGEQKKVPALVVVKRPWLDRFKLVNDVSPRGISKTSEKRLCRKMTRHILTILEVDPILEQRGVCRAFKQREEVHCRATCLYKREQKRCIESG